MRTNPLFCRSVTALARDALAELEPSAALISRHIRQWLMTGSAAHIRRWVLDVKGVSDLFRARGRQRGCRPLRMKVFKRPKKKLVLFFRATAVATGAGARTCPDKFRQGLSATHRHAPAKLTDNNKLINCFSHTPKLVNRMAA